MHITAKTVIDSFIVGFFVRGILLGLVEWTIISWLQKLLIKSAHDAVLYWHYYQHYAKRGHSERKPVNCQDEDCKTILE